MSDRSNDRSFTQENDVMVDESGRAIKGRPNIRASIYHAYTKAQQDKKSYTDKLEETEGDDIFKYLLLIDTSALDGYVNQTRLQAEQSFQLSKYVAIVGFVLISIGIVLGIYSSYMGRNGLEAAYLASLAGILTEFISGVFFYLYNRTLQQLNLFHDKMLSSKQMIMSFLANSLVEDDVKRDDSKVELSKMLMSSSGKQ